jgi:hypothetical protein
MNSMPQRGIEFMFELFGRMNELRLLRMHGIMQPGKPFAHPGTEEV